MGEDGDLLGSCEAAVVVPHWALSYPYTFKSIYSCLNESLFQLLWKYRENTKVEKSAVMCFKVPLHSKNNTRRIYCKNPHLAEEKK